MKNKFIIAGHNVLRPGAIAYNGKTEHSYNAGLQARIIEGAKTYIAYSGTSITPETDDENKTLHQVIHRVNREARPGDAGVDIHFNFDFPATGTEIFIHPYTNDKNKRRAVFIVNEISNVLGIPLRRSVGNRDYKYPLESARKRLAILEDTSIPFTLPEICFMNQSDLSKYEAGKDDVAQIIKLAYFSYSFNKQVSFHIAHSKIMAPVNPYIKR